MTDREKLVELLDDISYEQELSDYDLWDMREAAELIADFLIANGVTVREWISVEDKLPDPDEYVLCWYTDDNDKAWHTVGRITSWNEKWELDINGDEYFDKTTVTHWMPLPELPKEE